MFHDEIRVGGIATRTRAIELEGSLVFVVVSQLTTPSACAPLSPISKRWAPEHCPPKVEVTRSNSVGRAIAFHGEHRQLSFMERVLS
jgi:hypothetical protein